MRRDSATFDDRMTEVPSLSRDKGTTGQAKNLVKGLDGPGQMSKSGTIRGTGWYEILTNVLSHPPGQNETEQKRMF